MYSPYKETWSELLKLDAETRNARIMADLEVQYAEGKAFALLDAVSFCLNRDIATPEWVISGFGQAWEIRWALGISRTMDEAFEIERPKNWRQKRAQKDHMTMIMWRKATHHHRDNGESISRNLFELVAEELNEELSAGALADLYFNGTDVQEAYYAVEHLTWEEFHELVGAAVASFEHSCNELSRLRKRNARNSQILGLLSYENPKESR